MSLVKQVFVLGIIIMLLSVSVVFLTTEPEKKEIKQEIIEDNQIVIENPSDDLNNEITIPKLNNLDAPNIKNIDEKIQYTSSATKQTKTIVLAADNPIHQAQNQGLTYDQSSTGLNKYSCKAYSRILITQTQRGWAIFDLNDLTKWSGLQVINAELVIRNYQMQNVKTMNFSAINTTPYENAPSSIAGMIYNESALESNFIGNFTTNEYQNNTYHDLEIQLNSKAVDRINERINTTATNYPFPIGMHVFEYHSTSPSAKAEWMDIRLAVTFECDWDIETNSSDGGVAFGDALNGIIVKSSPEDKNYPIGRMLFDSNRRNYVVWNISMIKELFDDDNATRVHFTKVGLSFNIWSLRSTVVNNLSVYQLSINVYTANATAIYTDCGDGKKYFGLTNDSIGRFKEYNWTLSNDALNDFQDAFDDSAPVPFGMGLIWDSDDISYGFSPKLVLEWKFNETDDNTQPVADANGPYTGYVGDPIQLDGSGSYDPGNDILEYQWDLDDDGFWDTPRTTKSKFNHTWLTEYIGRIRLWVTDGNNSDTDYANVSIRKKPHAGNDTEIDVDPNTLNPKSNGNWITCYIEVPSGYNVSDIDRSSIVLNGNLSAESKWFSVGDHDGDGIADVMVKFDRQAVIAMVEPGDSVEMTVTFEINGDELSGTDYIRVLDKEKKDKKK